MKRSRAPSARIFSKCAATESILRLGLTIGGAMPKTLLPALALFVFCSSSAAADALPRPAGLEPNVRFWSRIYSEVGGDGGLIHDNENLDVVYEAIRFPEGLSRRNRERRHEAAKSRIRTALKALGRGKRTNLTQEEARILALWPKGTSSATFARATRRIRFQLGQAEKFRAGLIRQGAWKAYIEQVLAEHGVPKDLVALPHVESSYNPHAYSRVGAAGMWQFTRSTGRRYLRIDTVIDERLDPHRATVAAARLLRDNYESLGAWPLAITAYNHGTGGMRRAVRKLGTRDIAVISKKYKGRTFGFASRNFYPSFLAAREIDANPARYFGPLRRDHPVVVETLEMPHYYDASSLARALGIGVDRLREFNPALRPSVWNGSKYVPRGFELRIPQGSAAGGLQVALQRIPASERRSKQHRDRLYKVRSGDSLSLIASRYNVSVGQLVAHNNLRSQHKIRAGQVLVLPDDASSAMSYAKRWTMPADGTYTVRRGDSLGRIAKGFGIPEADLLAFNELPNRNVISVGQKIRVARPAVTATATPPTTERTSLENGSTGALAARTLEPSTETPGTVEAAAIPAKAVLTEPTPTAEAREIVAAPIVDDAQPLAEPSASDSVDPIPSTGDLVAALDFELPEEEPALFLERFPVETDSGKLAEIEEIEEKAELAELDSSLSVAPSPLPAGQLPDPSHYAVDGDGSIVVQADETLGHYADWLEVRTSRLRSLNRMRRNSAVVIGRRTKLDFTHVSRESFERRRLEYHRTLQEEFFGSFTVTGTETHILRRGDTMWYLARQKYKLPVWLLRQYNPDLDFAALSPGAHMVIPNIEPTSG